MHLENSVLAIDIGSGTQDILVRRHGIPMENSPKMILPSATTILSRKIDQATKRGQHIFLSGNVMGGGPSSAAARRHLRAGFKVFSMAKTALTFHDNLDKVRAMGIDIVEKPPEHLTRMQAICEIAPGALVMDTGVAAILGALTDPWISTRREEGVTIVNIGNEHILAALVQGDLV